MLACASSRINYIKGVPKNLSSSLPIIGHLSPHFLHESGVRTLENILYQPNGIAYLLLLRAWKKSWLGRGREKSRVVLIFQRLKYFIYWLWASGEIVLPGGLLLCNGSPPLAFWKLILGTSIRVWGERGKSLASFPGGSKVGKMILLYYLALVHSHLFISWATCET